MVTVLDEGKPGMGSLFGQGLSSGLNQSFGALTERATAKNLAETKQKKDTSELFQTGLQTIASMREVRDRGNLGRGSGFYGWFGGDTARDRAEYEQLGKSLIPVVAAGVPIRNQKEFDEYKKVLVNPSSTNAEIDGALDGLESILEGKLKGKKKGKSSSDQLKKVARGTPITPDIVSILKKKTNGNKEKAMMVARELGYEV